MKGSKDHPMVHQTASDSSHPNTLPNSSPNLQTQHTSGPHEAEPVEGMFCIVPTMGKEQKESDSRDPMGGLIEDRCYIAPTTMGKEQEEDSRPNGQNIIRDQIENLQCVRPYSVTDQTEDRSSMGPAMMFPKEYNNNGCSSQECMDVDPIAGQTQKQTTQTPLDEVSKLVQRSVCPPAPARRRKRPAEVDHPPMVKQLFAI